MLIPQVESFYVTFCWLKLSFDFPGKWGSSVNGDSVILVATLAKLFNDLKVETKDAIIRVTLFLDYQSTKVQLLFSLVFSYKFALFTAAADWPSVGCFKHTGFAKNKELHNFHVFCLQRVLINKLEYILMKFCYLLFKGGTEKIFFLFFTK